MASAKGSGARAAARARRYAAHVTPDAELVVLLAGLHILGFAFAALLLALLIRPTTRRPGRPTTRTTGAAATTARRARGPRARTAADCPCPTRSRLRTRLRGHERLADTHPRPPRRAPARAGAPARVSPAGRQRAARTGGPTVGVAVLAAWRGSRTAAGAVDRPLVPEAVERTVLMLGRARRAGCRPCSRGARGTPAASSRPLPRATAWSANTPSVKRV